MNKTKNLSNAKESNVSRKWTEIEQKQLKDLVDNGTVSLYDSAKKIKDSHECFDKFSNSVIAYHMSTLLKSPDPRTSRTGIVPPVNDVLADIGIVPQNIASSSLNTINADRSSRNYDLIFENMPSLRYSYMKYDTKQEKVVLMVDLPGGTGDYDWEFNDDGDAVTITGNWSRAFYDVRNLFQSSLLFNHVTLEHPKLHAMQNEVVRQGFSSKNIPQFRIPADLGRRVQKDDGTWNVEIIQHDGNKILFFEFSGFQEEVLKLEKRGKFR